MWCSTVRSGQARQSRVWCGMVWRCEVEQGKDGIIWHSKCTLRGGVRRGWVRRGMARYGTVRPGEVWPGKVRQGRVCHGRARE